LISVLELEAPTVPRMVLMIAGTTAMPHYAVRQ